MGDYKDGGFRFTVYVIILVVIMGFIFIQSAFPATVSRVESGAMVRFLGEVFGWTPDNASFLVRKAGHFLEYLVLGIVLGLATGSLRKRRRLPYWGQWIVGTAFAMTDELHQYFVPGRSCEFRDVVIDSCGVALGIIIVKAIFAFKKNMNTAD